MTGKPLTTAEQIAGYLKLTRAHYYLNGRDEEFCLDLRSLLAKEMSCETILLASQLQYLIGGKYDGMAA